MTEEEWLACDDARTMLQVVSQYPPSKLEKVGRQVFSLPSAVIVFLR